MEHKHGSHDSHGGHHGHHIVPLKVYYTTLLALLVLTVITVGVSYVDFGSTMNVVVALSIASLKASLVLLFFMGLKYDTILNRAYIMSSFVALAILIIICASDLWTRPKPNPVRVKALASALTEEDFTKLMASNAGLVEKGKGIYGTNCAVCHGVAGLGDGVGGASLNPKPRNFQTAASEWKNGTSFKAIYVTLAEGIAGGGMASYKALSPEDRIALTHFVLSLTKDIEKESKADLRFAKAKTEDGIGAAGAGKPKVNLPVDFALERVMQN